MTNSNPLKAANTALPVAMPAHRSRDVPPARRAPRRTYPRKADIHRAITTARECGLNITSVEIGPDGSIRLSEAFAVQSSPLSDFDRLDAEGLL